MSEEEVLVTVLEAMQEASDLYSLKSRLILCTLRHYPENISRRTSELAIAYAHEGVVALDLASDEAHYPIDPHIRAFLDAKMHGLFTTAHAGEAAGPESVKETLKKLNPDRIGHGVRAIEDSVLLQDLTRRQVHLEVCPSSNIQTNVFSNIHNHPIDLLINEGISLSINSDARTITNTSLNREYRQLVEVFNWDKSQFLDCNLEAVKHAFISESEKTGLMTTLKDAYLD